MLPVPARRSSFNTFRMKFKERAARYGMILEGGFMPLSFPSIGLVHANTRNALCKRSAQLKKLQVLYYWEVVVVYAQAGDFDDTYIDYHTFCRIQAVIGSVLSLYAISHCCHHTHSSMQVADKSRACQAQWTDDVHVHPAGIASYSAAIPSVRSAHRPLDGSSAAVMLYTGMLSLRLAQYLRH